MKYFICIIVVAGVCAEQNGGYINPSSAENMKKIADENTDQNTASDNVKIDTNNFGGNFGRYGERNSYGSLGRNIEDFLFGEKYAEDLYRKREEKESYDKNGFGERYPGSIGDKTSYGSYGRNFEEFLYGERNKEEPYREREERERYEKNRFDEGNPDIHGRIQRPCQVYDTFCIRKFFAEHSRCKISGRQVPEPLFRAQTTFNIPGQNMSATLLDTEYKGIKDGKVVEFYIDKVTDNLVIALDFDSVTFFSNDVNVKYYHRGREPTVLRDVAGASFLKLTVTVVIPNLKDLRLDRAEITTSTPEPVPPPVFGPRIGLSTDPEVILMFAAVLANVPQDAMESLSTEGVFYASNFIQYNICDFGLKAL